jgi:hypothetical protein
MKDTTVATILKHNEFVRFSNYRPNTTFYVGSVEGMAKEHGDDPDAMLTLNAVNAARMRSQDHSIAWIAPRAGVITSHIPTNQRNQRDHDEARVLTMGQVVEIEGREYVTKEAPNNNVYLYPVVGGEYGHVR